MKYLNYINQQIDQWPIHYWWHRFVDMPIFDEWIEWRSRAHILQIGCGRGQEARYIESHYPCAKYLALDRDPMVIAKAESLTGSDSKIVFQVSDYEHLPFDDESFDIVISFDTFHHIERWKKALREVHRVLKKKGKLALKTFSVETFNIPIIGLITQQWFSLPVDTMFDQIEFLTYVKKNGFAITHQNDSPWMLILVASKQGNAH